MTIKKTFHHEEHEGLLCRCMILSDDLKSESFRKNSFRIFFVPFVVGLGFSG